MPWQRRWVSTRESTISPRSSAAIERPKALGRRSRSSTPPHRAPSGGSGCSRGWSARPGTRAASSPAVPRASGRGRPDRRTRCRRRHRRVPPQERQQRLEILCLADDLDPGLIEEVAHAAAEDRMRVREDSSMLGHSGVHGTSSGGLHVVPRCAAPSDGRRMAAPPEGLFTYAYQSTLSLTIAQQVQALQARPAGSPGDLRRDDGPGPRPPEASGRRGGGHEVPRNERENHAGRRRRACILGRMRSALRLLALLAVVVPALALASPSLAAEPPNPTTPASAAGRTPAARPASATTRTTATACAGSATTGTWSPAAHTFCIDLRFWYPSKTDAYRELAIDKAGLRNRAGQAVSPRMQQEIAYAVWNAGQSNDPNRQAAVMLYVHSRMGDAAPGEVDPNALGAAVTSLYSDDRRATRPASTGPTASSPRCPRARSATR